MTIRTADGLSAILDEAHWQAHIISNHPELNGSWERVVETLQQPAAVFRSKRDQKTRIYVRYYGSSGFSVGLPAVPTGRQAAIQAGQLLSVIPVKTGIQSFQVVAWSLDSRLRGNDVSRGHDAAS